MNEYCTLTELKRVVVPAGTTTDDTILQRMLGDACVWLNKRTRRLFYPRIATRYYDYPAAHPSLLVLDDHLLDLTTLTTENGTVTIVNTDYHLMCGADYNLTPYDRILLKDNGSQVTFQYSASIQKSQAVTGVWGYRELYSEAWQDANDTVKTNYTANGTTIAVNDADGVDIWNVTPRFQAGQILRIDTEFFYVTAVTAATTNTLTVRPAWNGSTAANHSAGATIYVWRPQEDIFQAALDLTAWLYRHKDVREQGQIAYPSLGVTMNPDRLPTTVQEVLKRYAGVSL